MAKITKIKTGVSAYDNLRPVLVDFQNGVINAGQENQLACGLFEDKSSKYCAVSNGNLTYAGNIDNDDLYTNFILVHNKKKNKIKLLQADHCMLAPIFEKRDQLLDVSITDNAMNDLNKTFGSKKTKRQTEQRERLKMNIESVKDELEKTVTDIKVDDSLLVNSSENSGLYPKINRDASSLEQVYNLEDLVPLDVFESLQEEAFHVLESHLNEVEGLSTFASSNIALLQNSSSNSNLKAHKCSILLYINYIIKLIIMPAKTLSRNLVVCASSPKVDRHIKDTFLMAAKTGWHRPLSLKDKSLCYILVLAILAMDYKVDIGPLAVDTKVSTRKLSEMARMLALSTDKDAVKLKLPLPPVVSPHKRRRKT